MKHQSYIIAFCLLFLSLTPKDPQKIFDVHLHGSNDVSTQLKKLGKSGVYKAAISTSWNLQNSYRNSSEIDMLFGLMFPCPNGKVPYSLQDCYESGHEWPSVNWVEDQIKESRINFLGEILTQYFGISPSDSLMDPYYALAEKYSLSVGIHTGGAGPNHGSPNFKMELGSPLLLEKIFSRFSNLKVWIMHSGDKYYKETIDIMKRHPQVYADISVISNPDIVPSSRFDSTMKIFIDAGLEDRLMFGTDNGDVGKVINAIEKLAFLSGNQKDKIFYQNAERFFAIRKGMN